MSLAKKNYTENTPEESCKEGVSYTVVDKGNKTIKINNVTRQEDCGGNGNTLGRI